MRRRILNAIHPGDTNHDTDSIFNEKAEVSVTTNSLMVRYGHEKEDVEKVQIDCHALDYISSAGLRVLLIMKKGCKVGVSLKGMNDLVRDILDQTGFSEIIA